MIQQNYYAVIMAGGVGSRFWPMSRTSRPKQFIDILGVGRTLIQMTFDRLSELIPEEHIFIVTGERYKALVQEQLPLLDESRILMEPFRRNTAPCIAYATQVISRKDPNALIFVAPSDHLILDKPSFLNTVQKAFAAANEKDHLITIGIQPSRPDTNYGYIEIGQEIQLLQSQKVRSFKEKPDAETAAFFVAQKTYLWNSGMFCWSVRSILTALEKYAPEVSHAFSAYESPLASFEHSPSISIDYAVMEKADNAYVIPAEFGWSDLGTWESLYALADHDESGNVVDSPDAQLFETRGCIIKSHRTVVCDSVDNLLIVDTPDVLLVCKRDDTRFKTIAEQMSAKY